ncbi:hypothetical protein BC835DRAFT_213573 [Cytidiella melzeri]|nr:hypothetical protein BC835DRAFT_213573 [Cytidiella melzeri]
MITSSSVVIPGVSYTNLCSVSEASVRQPMSKMNTALFHVDTLSRKFKGFFICASSNELKRKHGHLAKPCYDHLTKAQPSSRLRVTTNFQAGRSLATSNRRRHPQRPLPSRRFKVVVQYSRFSQLTQAMATMNISTLFATLGALSYMQCFFRGKIWMSRTSLMFLETPLATASPGALSQDNVANARRRGSEQSLC